MLCHPCTESNNQRGICERSQEVRALTGLWVTEEFNTALQLGFRVGEITAVWHCESRSSSGFTGYIQTFLKGKQDTCMRAAGLHLVDAPLRNNHYFYTDKPGRQEACRGLCCIVLSTGGCGWPISHAGCIHRCSSSEGFGASSGAKSNCPSSQGFIVASGNSSVPDSMFLWFLSFCLLSWGHHHLSALHTIHHCTLLQLCKLHCVKRR